MSLLSFFTRRNDGRAEPFDAEAYEAMLEENLRRRRMARPQRSLAALKGARTKRRAG